MPANWVDTEREEKAWKMAKRIVEKQRGKSEKEFTDRDWGLVTHIAQNILNSARGVSIIYRPKTVQESRVMLRAGLDEEYEAFFKQKLEEYGVSSPSELSDEDKKKFFNEIEVEWEEGKGPSDVDVEAKDLEEAMDDDNDLMASMPMDVRADAVAELASSLNLPSTTMLKIEEAAAAINELVNLKD